MEKLFVWLLYNRQAAAKKIFFKCCNIVPKSASINVELKKRKDILKFIKSTIMNKFLLSIATMLMMGFSAFAANDDGIANQQAVRSFKKDFSKASNIVWEQKDTYTRATFSLNGQILFAYYSDNGDLQAVVRNITSDQLPINLLSSFKKDYSDYWISDLFEVASNGQTSYYVTLESSEKKIVLRSEGADSWEVYSKEKKQTIQ